MSARAPGEVLDLTEKSRRLCRKTPACLIPSGLCADGVRNRGQAAVRSRDRAKARDRLSGTALLLRDLYQTVQGIWAVIAALTLAILFLIATNLCRFLDLHASFN
ncbi:hypothetical protein ACFORG_16240 [Lutimaribacter marinistellae]|uniref:Uncharacterized protein n=1 Tax=Lutimaribacter marinistellae TaxID=1820329 RepID=A0ABV7TNA5_9RHOB